MIKNYRNLYFFTSQTIGGDQNNLYNFLKVSQFSDANEIKKAYYAKAKQLHPDLHKGNKEFQNTFKYLQIAYSILKDPERKQFYDRHFLQSQFQSFEQFQQEYEHQFKNKHLLYDQQSTNDNPYTQQYNSQQYKSKYQQNSNYNQYEEHSGQGEYGQRYSQYKDYNNRKSNESYYQQYEQSQQRYKEKKQQAYKEAYHRQKKQYHQRKKALKENIFYKLKMHWFLAGLVLFTLDFLWDFLYEEELEQQILRDMGLQNQIQNQKHIQANIQPRLNKKPQNEVQETEIRRNNVVMSRESISDSPAVQAARLKNLNIEKEEKQFSIILQSNKMSKKEERRQKKEEKRLKKEGMESLETLGKELQVKIYKTTKQQQKKPKVHQKITLEQYNQLGEDEYM